MIFLVAVACFICYICCNPGALPTIQKQLRERWGRLCCRDVPVPDTGQIEPEAQGFPLDEIPFRNGMSMPISVQSHSLPPSALTSVTSPPATLGPAPVPTLSLPGSRISLHLDSSTGPGGPPNPPVSSSPQPPADPPALDLDSAHHDSDTPTSILQRGDEESEVSSLLDPSPEHAEGDEAHGPGSQTAVKYA